MFKINNDMRRRDIPQNILEQLSLVPVGEIKVAIALFTFIVLDLICFLPIIADPFVKEFLYLVVPFLLFTNVWALALIVRNAYSTQIETVLFIGYLGAVSAFCFLVLSQKLAFFVAGMDSIIFPILSVIVYICVIFYFISYYKKRSSNKNIEKGSKSNVLWSLLYISPAAGYIIYHSILKESQFLHHAMVFVFLLLGIFFVYISVKFFYKYFLMKANIYFVTFQEPSKKEKKQALAKGKEIVIK